MWWGWYSCHILNLSTLAPHKRWQRSRSPHIPQRERGEGEQIKQYRGYKNKIRKIWHKKRGGSECSKPLNRGKDKKVRQEEQGDCEEGRASGKKRDSLGGEYLPNLTSFPQIMPDRQTHTVWTLLVILPVNWQYNVLTWCNQRDLASQIEQEMEKDWETGSGGGNQGPAWMARVGL